MNKSEYKDSLNLLLNSYEGILINYPLINDFEDTKINYQLDCEEYKEIIQKYKINEIAGKGSEFTRCKRLLHYLASRLTHSPYYDNHINCNALDLLEYSLNNKEHGINCLNKAKIFTECALALGIKSRRLFIMPYSPYDMDNHVVSEIYDTKLKKWIMMDPTTDGYFIDENKMPLSMLEIRDIFAHNKFITFVTSTTKINDLNKLRDKYLDKIIYIAKNSFYFIVGENQRFGDEGNKFIIMPKNYDLNKNKIINCDYIINNLPEENKNLIPYFEEQKQALLKSNNLKNHSSIILK